LCFVPNRWYRPKSWAGDNESWDADIDEMSFDRRRPAHDHNEDTLLQGPVKRGRQGGDETRQQGLR